MIGREIIINISLTLVILALGMLIVTSSYELPTLPQLSLRESSSDTETTGTQTLYPQPAAIDSFPNFGQRNIFETIIPRPTPVPAPLPTPALPPRIQVLLRTWRLVGVIGDQVILNDTLKREEFTMKVGDKRRVEYQGRPYTVTLSEINQMNFSVTFTFEDQQLTLNLF